MRLQLYPLVLAAGSLLLASCSNDSGTPRPALQVATTYDSTAYMANASSSIATRNQLSQLTAILRRGRTPGTLLTRDEILAAYNGGSPTLASQTTAYYNALIPGWAETAAQASQGGTYDATRPPAENGQGGTLGGYLFDENGAEMEQYIEKGLFGAGLYHEATLRAASGEQSVVTVDQILGLYGANPTFPNTPTAANTRRPDTYMAMYAARRTRTANGANTGLYFQLREAFLRAQSAAKAGSEYQAEYRQALDDVFLGWEKTTTATVINYCHSTIAGLSATSPTPVQLGAALHAHGEAVGFLHGFKTINKKRITDAQIDEVLTLLNSPGHNGAPYRLVGSPTELAKLTQAISRLQTIYGFTNAEVEDMKQNWVTVEGR